MDDRIAGHLDDQPAPVDVAGVVARIDAATPFVSVVTTGGPRTTWLADVAAHVRAGADPLAPWRQALQRQQSATNAVAVPPHVPAAFVLQWWCEFVATPLAYAAGLGEWLLVPEPAGLGLELAPALFPQRIVVAPEHASVERVPDGPARERRAREVYDGLVAEVVQGFAPEVKMSSRQRWGVVDDLWATAVRRAAGAAGHSLGPEPVRASCCFIFVLPGMRECASCPRSGRAAAH